MKETSPYLLSSRGTKNGQGQATKLFPGDYYNRALMNLPLPFLQCLKDAIKKHTTEDPGSHMGEVLLKDKFLTQSAPDINRKLKSLWLKGKKSLDQVIQLAMSVYYNQNLTKKRDKDKKHQDLIAVLGSSPPNGAPLPGHAINVDRKDTSIESVKEGGILGDSPSPLPWDHVPYVRATIGGLTIPISGWKAGCHLAWIDGSWGLLSRLSFLISKLRSLRLPSW
jgi:hypothetical protein